MLRTCMSIKKENRDFMTLMDKILWGNNGVFEGKFEDKKFAIGKYNEHIEYIKRIVPKEQLLIFNVKDGWDPLLKFLGKEMPKEYENNKTFPMSNQTKDVQKQINSYKYFYYGVVGVITVGLTIGGYCLSKKVAGAYRNRNEKN